MQKGRRDLDAPTIFLFTTIHTIYLKLGKYQFIKYDNSSSKNRSLQKDHLIIVQLDGLWLFYSSVICI